MKFFRIVVNIKKQRNDELLVSCEKAVLAISHVTIVQQPPHSNYLELRSYCFILREKLPPFLKITGFFIVIMLLALFI